MAEHDDAAGAPRRACCMVSEIIEEAGLDRETARRMRRQVLQGLMLFCEWQLQRIDETEAASPRPRAARKPKRVPVE